MIRNKSDNCSTQYKCGKVFGEYLKLAKKYNRNIKYYGPSGHGKGMVDAMNAFGVKTPLLKSFVAHDFKYKSSKDICTMLQAHFEGDEQKKYSVRNNRYSYIAIRSNCNSNKRQQAIPHDML